MITIVKLMDELRLIADALSRSLLVLRYFAYCPSLMDWNSCYPDI